MVITQVKRFLKSGNFEMDFMADEYEYVYCARRPEPYEFLGFEKI